MAFQPSPMPPPVPSPMPSPPPSPPSLPSSVFNYAYVVSDSQIITSLVLSVMCGLAVLIIYPIIRQPFGCYSKRTEIEDLAYRPKPIFVQGIKKAWAHFLPVLLVNEKEILETAGLDAFLLLRTMVLGIQLFLPLSIFGCAILLPLALTGKEIDNQASNGVAVSSSLMYYSMANIDPGSGLLIVYTAVIFGFFFYTYWLVVVHYRSNSILRAKYLTHQRPLRKEGDYGVMHLIGLTGEGKLGAGRRFLKVCREVLSPCYMFQQSMEEHHPVNTPSEPERNERKESKGAKAAEDPQVPPLPPSFIDHQRSWQAFDPLKDSLPQAAETVSQNPIFEADGILSHVVSPKALFPWWTETEKQPAGLHDDTNMLFVGKSVVERRQLVPARTFVGAALKSRPDVKVLMENYAVLIQCTQAPGRPHFNFPTSTGPVSLIPGGLGLPGGLLHQLVKRPANDKADIEEPKFDALDGRSSKSPLMSPTLAQAQELYEAYSKRFPTTFKALVPVYNHQEVDDLLVKLDGAMGHVESLVAKIELDKKKDEDSPEIKANEEKLPELMKDVRDLEEEVLKAREKALSSPIGVSFFALFSNKGDALIAATCPPVGSSLSGLWSYRVMKAPSPDDINFQTLWTPFYARQWRCFWTLFPLVLAILFPIGLLTGAITNIHQALCSGTPQTNPLYVSSICDAVNNFWTRLLKDIVTGLLPTIINTFFDTYVMPLVFFFITQAERSYVSFSSQDRKVAYYFLIYDIINSFLMVVFSSGIIAQIGNVVNKAQNHTTTHTSYISNIANALNGSCNFFFNNILWKSFFTNIFRFVWPHDGTVIFVVLRAMGLFRPQCSRDRAVIRGTPGFRGGRHFGALFSVFIPGLCYGVINPVILPLCLAYFLTCYIAWKYSILYFYERSQESGGQMIEVVMYSMFDSLKLAAFFTGFTLLSVQAWWCGAVVLVILPIATIWFQKGVKRFSADTNVPLEFVDRSPEAIVNPLAYLPTGLRNGALGWFPDGQRVWEKYGVPRYV